MFSAVLMYATTEKQTTQQDSYVESGYPHPTLPFDGVG